MDVLNLNSMLNYWIYCDEKQFRAESDRQSDRPPNL